MIKLMDVRPLYSRVITTADSYDEDQYLNGLVVAVKGQFKEYQKVLKVGSMVREVQPGDMVCIDPTRYIKRKFSENSLRDDFDKNPVVSLDIPVLEIDGKNCFMIDDRDIMYVVTDYTDVPASKPSNIIVPKEQKIIL